MKIESKELVQKITEVRAEWLKNLIRSEGYGGNELMVEGARYYMHALTDVEDWIREMETQNE